MNEIERIIKNGILKEEFFIPEVQCEYLVESKMKKIWAVELDLLIEFDRVCKKNNLRYFLIFGTLLGAVRHQGFVPWDDDIDVAMPRMDYERLLKLSEEFKKPYFLQSIFSNDGSCYSFAKLRNSNTSAVTNKFCYESFNQGIWIDINPLDSYDLDNAAEKFSYVKSLGVDLGTYMRRRNPNLSEEDRKRVDNYSGRAPMETYEMIQEICRSEEKDGYPYLGIMVAGYYTYNKQTYLKEWFDDSLSLPFCGFEFPVPRGYVDVLKTTYGDYMQFPPLNKRGAWHPNEIFDTDNPYTKYLKKDSNESFNS